MGLTAFNRYRREQEEQELKKPELPVISQDTKPEPASKKEIKQEADVKELKSTAQEDKPKKLKEEK